MIALDDPHWDDLLGGYRLPYDPRLALQKLEVRGDAAGVWDELWNELHHQGDIGDCSYAAVVALVDIHSRTRSLNWNFYALSATIEIERHRRGNPPVPDWLRPLYRQAWDTMLQLALDDLAATKDPLLIRSVLAVVALAKGQTKLGVFLAYSDESEVAEFVEEHDAWSQLYHQAEAV